MTKVKSAVEITTSSTNKTEGSFQNVVLSLPALWSIAHDFACYRTSTVFNGQNYLPKKFSTINDSLMLIQSKESIKGDTLHYHGSLAKDYSDRAKIIAATYARFYLEEEEFGNTTLKGRHYWMGMGAFASKTVACIMETTGVPDVIIDDFGKGNFWLFQDIGSAHYFYNMRASAFMSLVKPSAPRVWLSDFKKTCIDKLPWVKEGALKILDNLNVGTELLIGFQKTQEIEDLIKKKANIKDIQPLQLKHLLAVANHEQGQVLQKIMYVEGTLFNRAIQAQRTPPISWVTPALELVFAQACSSTNEDIISRAQEGIKLEEFDSRMEWIKAAAKQYHGLMHSQKYAGHMQAELKKIAEWRSLAPKGRRAENIMHALNKTGPLPPIQA